MKSKYIVLLQLHPQIGEIPAEGPNIKNIIKFLVHMEIQEQEVD